MRSYRKVKWDVPEAEHPFADRPWMGEWVWLLDSITYDDEHNTYIAYVEEGKYEEFTRVMGHLSLAWIVL